MQHLSWMKFFIMILVALGCVQQVEARAEQVKRNADYGNEIINLGIVGYNYTQRYIADFSVDSNDGGNIMVSTPTSGGGGTACCAPYIPGVKSYTVSVRWQAGGCMYHVYSSISKETSDQIYPFYKEIKVPVTEDFVAPPKYMEVHFYVDGRVAVTVTDTESPPRLQLSDSRQDRSTYPRCPGDKMPEAGKI